MDAATRELVRQRAGQRCEYCLFPDSALELPFHVEHVIASVHRIDDSLSNLAWSCPRCNLRKGPNLVTVDPETDEMIDLFNPRTMEWKRHFALRNAVVVGLTPLGRGTARLLDMNNENRVRHRRVLIDLGEFAVE